MRFSKLKLCAFSVVKPGSECILPHRTFLDGVHGRAEGAVEGPGKVLRVGQRPQNPDWPRRVHRGADFGQRVLRPHRAAPDLRVVEEKELVVGEGNSRQTRLLAVLLLPLFVSLPKKYESHYSI